MTEFSRIKHLSGAQLAQFKTIYEGSFEEYERDPLEDIVDDVASEEMTLLAAFETDEMVGFAAFYALETSGDMYLPYLAVNAGLRGKGVGSQFFQYMTDYLSKNTESARLMWEVKTPPSDEVNLIENRRVRFYERLGARRIPFIPDYRIPYMDKTFGYLLYWVPLQDEDVSVSRDEVRSWIEDIYAIYYPESTDLLNTIIAEMEAEQP